MAGMAELPADIEIVDTRTDEGDWRFGADVSFPSETIRLDLRIHEDSDYLPFDDAVILSQLRKQWAIANDEPVIDQVRDRAGEPIILGFFL
jgi:hypothetical protein